MAFDAVSLGEVMLRLDPGEGRIRAARTFSVWEGGGEYNVARGLRRCFGYRTGVVTALVDNEIGRLVEDLILQGGVDTSMVRWEPFDDGSFVEHPRFGGRSPGHAPKSSSKLSLAVASACSTASGR
jgi:hypothetical protein